MPPLSKVWEHFHCDTTKYKTNKSNHKAYCCGCIGHAACLILHEENHTLAEGRMGTMRDIAEIEASVVAIKMKAACGTVVKFSSFELHALKGQVDTLWRHLQDCKHVAESVKAEARSKLSSKTQKGQAPVPAETLTSLPSRSTTPSLLLPVPPLPLQFTPPLIPMPVPSLSPSVFYGETAPQTMPTVFIRILWRPLLSFYHGSGFMAGH
ncbi:hypothetical protein VKT23_019602 [Stygiomarasmius scandens]|uniref:RNase H type-1 domain-containing protein n=1 Tax=Marasmiellus scandens TaxID=2682957 RepID=A0ABR1IQ64_9AGAR